MNNLIDHIGNTPLLKLSTSDNDRIQIYVKFEAQNPGGSVKDRAVVNMLKSGFREGLFNTGDRIIEATSGNTGIAIALYSKCFGLNCSLLMPDTASIERIKVMKAYGAEVILTPGELGIEYSRVLAKKLAKEQKGIQLDQFNNEYNWRAHYDSTGPEIWNATNGEITHFVSAMGTSGTIMGVSKYLKEKNKDINIIGVQPMEGESIPGIRKWSENMRPGIMDLKFIDNIVEVSRNQAESGAKKITINEGLFCGISTGGAFHAVSKVIQKIEEGVVVFVACDRGDRYLNSLYS